MGSRVEDGSGRVLESQWGCSPSQQQIMGIGMGGDGDRGGQRIIG
jgi:hypothetical protein